MNLATLVKNKRAALDWSMQQLGERCHIARSYICDIEHGRVWNISTTTAANFADALDIPLMEVVDAVRQSAKERAHG